MKIVHIITRMILGGAQENTLLTCEGLHARGHDVTLITGPSVGPEGQLTDRAHAAGYRVVEIPSLRRAINPFHDLPAYYQLKKLLTQLDPDIIHTHSAKAGILGRWAAATVRQDANRSCCSRLDKFRQAQPACNARPQIVHTIHGLAFHRYQPPWRNRFYIAIERSAAKNTDAFISVADAMTSQALAAGIGRPDQFTTIHSGLETHDFLEPPPAERLTQLRTELNIPTDALVVITVARLAELKGHQYIIDAAAQLAPRHPNVIWLFVGDGRLRSHIESLIARANLTDRFRLTGLVEPNRIGELLHASDILVHCSLREGLARVLPQAMLAAKPVISSDIDGAAEVVNENTGILIPPQDTPALITAQQTLITDPNLRNHLGAAGRDFCRQQFDHHLMVDKIEKLYKTRISTT